MTKKANNHLIKSGLGVAIIMMALICSSCLRSNKDKAVSHFDKKGGLIKMEVPLNGDSTKVLEIHFYENKKMKSSHETYQGKKEGLGISYYPNGSVKEEGKYKNGLPHGVFRYYFQDGTIATILNLNLGERFGEAIYFNRGGIPETYLYFPQVEKLAYRADFDSTSGSLKKEKGLWLVMLTAKDTIQLGEPFDLQIHVPRPPGLSYNLRVCLYDSFSNEIDSMSLERLSQSLTQCSWKPQKSGKYTYEVNLQRIENELLTDTCEIQAVEYFWVR